MTKHRGLVAGVGSVCSVFLESSWNATYVDFKLISLLVTH